MPDSLFVLECSSDKWYIASAKDVLHKVTYLECGFGPDWTRTYSPIRIVEQRPITGPTDVLDTTKKYMKTYGIDNVRCESMCYVSTSEYANASVTDTRFLDEEVERTLRFELYALPGSCSKCRGTGHLADACNRPLVTSWNCQYCVSDYPTKGACLEHERKCPHKPERGVSNSCTRCGRHEHTTDRCYEKKHTTGRWLQ
jgi:predicted GIY-YIG superfamily endonuclease